MGITWKTKESSAALKSLLSPSIPQIKSCEQLTLGGWMSDFFPSLSQIVFSHFLMNTVDLTGVIHSYFKIIHTPKEICAVHQEASLLHPLDSHFQKSLSFSFLAVYPFFATCSIALLLSHLSDMMASIIFVKCLNAKHKHGK